MLKMLNDATVACLTHFSKTVLTALNRSQSPGQESNPEIFEYEISLGRWFRIIIAFYFGIKDR
jgi:hypothetical protein